MVQGARDIDLLLITGAGASAPFGVNHTMLPMMAEWSDRTVDALAAHPGFLDATRLERSLEGLEFERRLGEFLSAVSAFGRIEQLLGPSTLFPPPSTGEQLVEETLRRWHHNAAFHLSQIVEVIHGSLYDNFGDPHVDVDKAAIAYQSLLVALGLGPSSRVVVATTNYDRIAEAALTRLGFRPDNGLTPDPAGSGPRLDITDLIDGAPRYTPVLHIHGCVGWYRSPASGVMDANSARYNRDFGVPLVMLPDPNKDYESDPFISSMWHQFTSALERAQRILVLGHSLHDQAIVDALRGRVDDGRRVGVCVLPSATQDGGVDPTAVDVLEVLNRSLPQARMMLMRFGDDLGEVRGALSGWMQPDFGG